MENPEIIQPVEDQFIINPEIKGYLLETSKWGKFLAIIGYVGMGLMLLLGVMIMVGGSIFSSMTNVGFPIRIMGLVYIVIGALYFIPVNYLYKFSTKMTMGFHSPDQEAVTSGFENLKSLFKFMGIFTIVILSIYILIIIVAVPIAIYSAMK
jgi:hypothetical protein